MTVQTTVTLEVIAVVTDRQQFTDLVKEFESIKGVNGIAIVRSSAIEPQTKEMWATLQIALIGQNKAALRKAFSQISENANRAPMRLTGRSRILADLYD